MKKILCCGLILLFTILLMPTAILATEDKEDFTTINITTNTTDYILTTKNDITEVSNTTIVSNSATSSITRVDTIGLRLYLQTINRTTGIWNNTGLSREFIDYNSSSIDKATLFSVSKGYQYRIKTVHFVKEGGTYNSETTYSSIIDLR
ncbi:hypothetical protein GCM10011351_28610 [Paraliobacillus quinghaiensis]|uniref:DUF5626 domain-containing protein n=1 Tax=Paraliobacillus quinghaiensis TaxID=470815 RepID=A0A917TW05_9BACI|nr:hypothetical protein [Paraliobacillus quinghaiensis]GGM40708.1 hypothetical protein GCM10011351_28610 [Paraliobacillus quinghaiensis]